MTAIRFALPMLPSLAPLLAASEAEGYHMVSRLAAALDECAAARDSAQALDQLGQFWLLTAADGAVAGVGGLTPDPYAMEPRRGRVRHVYVLPEQRRAGLASQLMGLILAQAQYTLLTLRTHNPAAAQLYERHGFVACAWPHTTHYRILSE